MVTYNLEAMRLQLYNLSGWFCMLMGLWCTICLKDFICCWDCVVQFTYVELVYFLCRFGMSCVVQFIYVELIYFLGFLEWEESCVVVRGGLMKCALRQKWKIVTQERSTIYGMVNNIIFEIDTLEKDVIKRKIMPWKISEVPEEMMVRYDTMTYHNNLK